MTLNDTQGEKIFIDILIRESHLEHLGSKSKDVKNISESINCENNEVPIILTLTLIWNDTSHFTRSNFKNFPIKQNLPTPLCRLDNKNGQNFCSWLYVWNQPRFLNFKDRLDLERAYKIGLLLNYIQTTHLKNKSTVWGTPEIQLGFKVRLSLHSEEVDAV